MNNATLVSLASNFSISLIASTIATMTILAFTKKGIPTLKTMNKYKITRYTVLILSTATALTFMLCAIAPLTTEIIKKITQIFGNIIAIIALIIETIKFSNTPTQHHSDTTPAIIETKQQRISALTLIAVAIKTACDLFSTL